MALRSIGDTALHRMLAECQDWIALCRWYDHDQVVCFPDLDFLDPLKKLLWDDHAFLCDLCLYKFLSWLKR